MLGGGGWDRAPGPASLDVHLECMYACAWNMQLHDVVGQQCTCTYIQMCWHRYVRTYIQSCSTDLCTCLNNEEESMYVLL